MPEPAPVIIAVFPVTFIAIILLGDRERRRGEETN
jgi:hypothetical protein